MIFEPDDDTCMSASDPRIHFELGRHTKIDSLEITRPGGQVDKMAYPAIDPIMAVKEGSGVVARKFPKVVVSGSDR